MIKYKTVPLFKVSCVRDNSVKIKEVNGPVDAGEVFKALLATADRESLVIAHLNFKNHLLGCEIVAIGQINTASITPLELLRGAIINGAVGIIIGHNHPTGNTEFSEEDETMTKHFKRISKDLGIELYDHLLIADNKVISARALGKC